MGISFYSESSSELLRQGHGFIHESLIISDMSGFVDNKIIILFITCRFQTYILLLESQP